MALRYGYFDSEIIGVDSEGMPIFDRAESSELFRLLFSKLLTNGVLAKPADCFKVIAGSTGLSVIARPGFGLINGAFAWDAAESAYTLEPAPASYSRIDRVVLRCNYLNRLCEIIIKTGTPASSPTPPALEQPASGDYYELGLALVQVAANQTAITQSSITDTRPDSSVCGYITQFIDSIDTSVFYDQFNAFYAEFVANSNASYAEFQQMAAAAFGSFTNEINNYIAALQAQGNAEVAEVVASLNEYEVQVRAEVDAWLETIRDLLDDETAARLAAAVVDLQDRVTLAEHMRNHNDYFAPLLDEEGNTILDEDGNAILGEWKYKIA